MVHIHNEFEEDPGDLRLGFMHWCRASIHAKVINVLRVPYCNSKLQHYESNVLRSFSL